MSAKFPRGGGGGANPFSAIRLYVVNPLIEHSKHMFKLELVFLQKNKTIANTLSKPELKFLYMINHHVVDEILLKYL